MALGQHLGANEYTWLTAVNLAQDVLDTALALGAVAVNPHHGRMREGGCQNVLGSLGSLANRFEGVTLAFRATLGGCCLVVAVMAPHGPVPAVIGEPGVAAGAPDHVAAVKAHHDRRKAAPIDENQCLVTLGEGLVNGVQGRPGKAAFQGAAANIQQADGRWRRIACAFFQLNQPVFALFRIVNRFKRGRG